jgi:hypothetical protein
MEPSRPRPRQLPTPERQLDRSATPKLCSPDIRPPNLRCRRAGQDLLRSAVSSIAPVRIYTRESSRHTGTLSN